MSDWASAALAGILATGAYNAWRVLGSPRDLVDLEYGHVLVFKLCFVMLAVALGGFNKFVGLPASLAARTPSASVQAGLRRVVTILRLESIALLLVLIAAAVLANNAPPAP
jgi:putative copper resistance protein D